MMGGRQYAHAILLVVLGLFLRPSSSAAASCTVEVWYDHSLLHDSALLYLRGSGNGLNWKSGMLLSRSSSNNDLWSTVLRAACDTGLALKVLVGDSDWQLGPNSYCFPVRSDPLATSSLCRVYPFFYSSRGSYVYVRDVFSEQLNNSRDLVVYLPPSFVENPYRTDFPLLIMHDGQNVFNASTAFMGNSWHAQETLDGLIMGEKMHEIMVVAVDNTADRIDELTYSVDPTVGQGGKADSYLDFIVQTVVPAAFERYPRFSRLAGSMGILGSSLGGLVSCYAAMTRPHVFPFAGCMSSSFWWNSEDFRNTILPMYGKDALSAGSVVYVDSGNAGPDNDDVVQTESVFQDLIQTGWRANVTAMHYVADGAQHSEVYWSQRFYVPLLFLYGVA
eukprot:ANDGO_05699.mRNA.1 Uncharacterized protein YbbA